MREMPNPGIKNREGAMDTGPAEYSGFRRWIRGRHNREYGNPDRDRIAIAPGPCKPSAEIEP